MKQTLFTILLVIVIITAKTQTNFVLNKTAIQSSTFQTEIASLAVTGLLEGSSLALTFTPEEMKIGIYSKTRSPSPEKYGSSTPMINELQMKNWFIETGKQITD